ncbi:fimbrial protein [Yersinia sp. 2541 StPb PI]|uniref:fimbrial protein n=1 Tax=Yersinia sp. 2541 StPb PI TaxID=3117407 RepID=UPI003FA4061D
MNNINKIIILGALLSCSQYALALATCTTKITPARTFVATLSPASITVGPDMPNGTVVYRLDFRDPGTATDAFTCGAGSFNAPQTLEYTSTPTIANWSGTPFPNRVYQTQVPGIGVVVSSDLSNQALPTVAYTTTYSGDSFFNFNVRINAVLSLIKIGPVSPGTINGALLPRVRLNLSTDPTLTNSTPIPIYNLSFGGSLNIVSQTCTTPDVNVAMGSFEVSKYFTGIGSTTPWKDASINLTNCPVFHGYFNNSSYNTSPGSGVTTVGQPINNTLSVKLTPATAILNSSNGIFAIDSSNASAAKGVGIQLGYGATSSPSLLDFSKNITVSLTSSQQSVKIPLSARYYQTASTVSPGRADGKVVFLINYY